MDSGVQQLHRRQIPLFKVAWENHVSGEATWEREDVMREHFPWTLVAGELWIDHKKLIYFPMFVCYDLCKPSSWSRPKTRPCLPTGFNLERGHQCGRDLAGNQAAAAARNGAGDLHRNFRSLNPPCFSGSPDPDEAEN
ncbi:hypothetical protein Taro_008311 [Colocasia esculenta]|uniref:Chromo domain-containing protein n=1 Tax=Colocasia esculenta TaxID=4460 RepID=A0A843TX82_COLES|nr:hypothetical protein [Colocasia esculenta]